MTTITGGYMASDKTPECVFKNLNVRSMIGHYAIPKRCRKRILEEV